MARACRSYAAELPLNCNFFREMSRVKFCRVELHVGAVWKDGACVICSVEELHNCPEDRCTADLLGASELSYLEQSP